MILRIKGDDLILVENIPDDMQDQFVSKNTGFIKIDYELPFSISGYYKYNNDNVIIVNMEKDLEALKLQRMAEIDDKFEDLLNYGTMNSSLGFTVENRRGNNKDDKDNVSSLIDLGNEPVYFKDHDNQFQSLTLDNLRTLKQEMIQDGLQKYQWKWQKEAEVMESTSLSDLYAIII